MYMGMYRSILGKVGGARADAASVMLCCDTWWPWWWTAPHSPAAPPSLVLFHLHTHVSGSTDVPACGAVKIKACYFPVITCWLLPPHLLLLSALTMPPSQRLTMNQLISAAPWGVNRTCWMTHFLWWSGELLRIACLNPGKHKQGNHLKTWRSVMQSNIDPISSERVSDHHLEGRDGSITLCCDQSQWSTDQSSIWYQWFNRKFNCGCQSEGGRHTHKPICVLVSTRVTSVTHSVVTGSERTGVHDE